MPERSVSVLLIDAGNTRMKWQLRERGAVQASGVAVYDDLITETLPRADKVLVASVLGCDRLISALHDANIEFTLLDQCDPHNGVITPCYSDPSRLGVDRWLAMLGARQMQQGAVLVIDAGTALTLDWLNADNQHVGGFILPGLRMGADALFSNTGKVKAYADELAEHSIAPGRDTLSCVANGLNYQQQALVAAVRNDYPDYTILVTGGDGQWLADTFGLKYSPDLVLDGMDSLCAGYFLA